MLLPQENRDLNGGNVESRQFWNNGFFCCRFVDSGMLLTYRTGQSALAAVAESSVCNMAGQTVRASLLTFEWQERIEDELSLTRSNTTAMYSATTNSLLGEDFAIPSMSFDMDGEWIWDAELLKCFAVAEFLSC
jgi:hypothetical protein